VKKPGLILVMIVLLAAGLRFWNVTHDSDLAHVLKLDARNKFAYAKSLATEGEIRTPPGRRYRLYRQPMFLLKSYAGIWRGVKILGFNPSDRTMRIGFNAYLIVMSLAVVVLVYRLGHLVTGRHGPALWAAYLFAVFPVNVVGTLYVKEDIPLMFWFTAAMLAVVSYMVTGRKVTFLSAGLLAGLAIGAKYPGALLLPILLLSHIFVVLESPRREWFRRLVGWQAIAALLMVLAGFLLFNHHAVTEWPEFCRGFQYQVSYASTGHHDGTIITGRDFLWLFYLRHAIAPGITIPATALSLCGLVLAFVGKNRQASLLAITAIISYLSFEVSPSKPFPFPARYLHFVYPLTAVLAAYAFGELWCRLDRSGRFRPVAAGLGLMLAAAPLVTSVLVVTGTRPDTRDQAAAWIEENLPNGSKIFMGSRIHSPQGLDQDQFEVRYFAKIYRKPIRALQNQGIDYLVTSSFDYDRYQFSLNSSQVSREAFAAYAELDKSLNAVRSFRPRFACQSYGEHNPIITIYAVPD
jgi:hypothetical protein